MWASSEQEFVNTRMYIGMKSRDTETGIPPERANPANIRVGIDQMGPEPVIQQVAITTSVLET